MPFKQTPAPPIVERFARFLQAQGFAKQTVISYRSYVRRLHEWLEDRPLDEVTVAMLEDFLFDTYGHLGYGSRHNSVVAMRTYWRWLRRRGEVSSDPAADLTWPKKRRHRPTYYTPEQAARLVREFQHPVDRLLTIVLLRQGQRLTPTVTLRWRQVDFGHGVVRYEPFKGGFGMTIPIDPDTARELRAWKALHPWAGPDDYVFQFRFRSKHRQQHGYRQALRTACRAAGVPYRGAHELRRTTATTLLQDGVPLHQVSRHLLGHAEVTTTINHYAGSDDSDIGGALARLPF